MLLFSCTCTFQWEDSDPIHCESGQLCPAGSYAPGTECDVMYDRNEQTDVSISKENFS